MFILSINAGSTSLKSCLYDLPADLVYVDEVNAPVWRAEISWQGNSEGDLKTECNRHVTQMSLQAGSREEAIEQIISRLGSASDPIRDLNEIVCVAHRVVHGGPEYSCSTVIDGKVIDALRNLEELAPNHEKENVRAIVVAQKVLPKALQVAVFDTSFYHNLPLTSAVYALPYDWYERDRIRRYGFHGISHEYLAKRAAIMLADASSDLSEHPSANPSATLRLITCHLGGGSSISATYGGRCRDTTMGFTPLEGLPMQTRSGSIDPGLIIHQLLRGGYTSAGLSIVLTKESGMKGISGLSGDMKEIEAAMEAGNERAQLAFDIYVCGVGKFAASLVPVIGGIDALVFAGGIGENSSNVRTSVCSMLSYLGLSIDEAKNVSGKNDRDISSSSSRVKVLVIHTQEELAMAQSAYKIYLDRRATAAIKIEQKNI